MSPRARTINGWLRLAGTALLLFFVIVMITRYDFETLPEGILELRDQVQPGALMVLADVDGGTALGRGAIIEVVVETGHGARRFFSRIAGLPGQSIALRPVKGGRLEILLDGHTTWATAPASTRLVPGLIPPRRYLLLDPAPGAGGADSRTLGLIDRGDIRRKLLYAF